MINILICRLQLGIEQDKAAANLLQMFRPGLVRLLSNAKQMNAQAGLDMDQMMSDIQSTTIELLINDYNIGDRGRATPYLFDPQQGFLTKWVKWMIGKNRRFYNNHELYNPLDGSTSDESDDPEEGYERAASGGTTSNSWAGILEGSQTYDAFDTNNIQEFISSVKDIIEDGITLNSNEYRVMQFCLYNSNEANASRHIDGLHIYLSKLMGVSRPRITRIYKRCVQKIVSKYTELHGENPLG
jgi:hypothetical protein